MELLTCRLQRVYGLRESPEIRRWVRLDKRTLGEGRKEEDLFKSLKYRVSGEDTSEKTNRGPDSGGDSKVSWNTGREIVLEIVKYNIQKSMYRRLE